MNVPAELKYTKDHEWVRLGSDGIVEMGITDYAQGELGDIIYIGIDKSIFDEIVSGEEIGTIEAVKTVAQIYSPISGKLQDINLDINDSPSDMNTDPYGKGWIIKIKPNDVNEIGGLMDADSYSALIGE